MKTFVFRGKSPSEALKKAMLEIGDDGVLLETKEIEKDSLYEVVTGIRDLENLKNIKKNNNFYVERSEDLKEIKSEITKLADKIKLTQDVSLSEKVPPYEYKIPP